MKTSLQYSLLIAATGLAGLASQANAASLTNEGWEFLHSQGGGALEHDISVFDGSAGYAGIDDTGAATSGTFGDGTVEAYAFFSGDDGGDGFNNGNDTITTIASGGTSITGTVGSVSMQQVTGASDIWETTDPVGFTTTADYTNPTQAVGFAGTWSGSIDISTYTSGTVYFLYGHYRGGTTAQGLNLTMADTNGPELDIQLLNAGSTDSTNNWEQYVVATSFVNDLGYDTIDYEIALTNGRVGGIVVNGIPEPSTLALLGLSGMLLLIRRRR